MREVPGSVELGLEHGCFHLSPRQSLTSRSQDYYSFLLLVDLT